MKYIEYSRDEFSVLENASVPITKQNMKDVLFGFADLNAGPEMYGAYGDFSFLLYKSGLVKVQEYLFSNVLAEEHRYAVPQFCVNEIIQYYSDNQNLISSLYAPDNDSCDGSFSEFFFGNDWISALNIDYHDESAFIRARKAHQELLDYRARFRVNVAHELETNPTAADDSTFQIAMSLAKSFGEKQEDFSRTEEIMRAENQIMSTFFDVCEILKKYDIILEQFKVTVKGVSTTTYSEFNEQVESTY